MVDRCLCLRALIIVRGCRAHVCLSERDYHRGRTDCTARSRAGVAAVTAVFQTWSARAGCLMLSITCDPLSDSTTAWLT